jgi:hypothetical protein
MYLGACAPQHTRLLPGLVIIFISSFSAKDRREFIVRLQRQDCFGEMWWYGKPILYINVGFARRARYKIKHRTGSPYNLITNVRCRWKAIQMSVCFIASNRLNIGLNRKLIWPSWDDVAIQMLIQTFVVGWLLPPFWLFCNEAKRACAKTPPHCLLRSTCVTKQTVCRGLKSCSVVGQIFSDDYHD